MRRNGRSKLISINGEEGMEYGVQVDRVCLENVSELTYLGCVLDNVGTDGAECSRKMASAIGP